MGGGAWGLFKGFTRNNKQIKRDEEFRAEEAEEQFLQLETIGAAKMHLGSGRCGNFGRKKWSQKKLHQPIQIQVKRERYRVHLSAVPPISKDFLNVTLIEINSVSSTTLNDITRSP